DGLLRPPDLRPDAGGRQPGEVLVRPGVVGDLVPLQHHAPDDLRMLLHHLAQHEERGAHAGRLQDVEQPLGVLPRPVVERQRDAVGKPAVDPPGRRRLRFGPPRLPRRLPGPDGLPPRRPRTALVAAAASGDGQQQCPGEQGNPDSHHVPPNVSPSARSLPSATEATQFAWVPDVKIILDRMITLDHLAERPAPERPPGSPLRRASAHELRGPGAPAGVAGPGARRPAQCPAQRWSSAPDAALSAAPGGALRGGVQGAESEAAPRARRSVRRPGRAAWAPQRAGQSGTSGGRSLPTRIGNSASRFSRKDVTPSTASAAPPSAAIRRESAAWASHGDGADRPDHMSRRIAATDTADVLSAISRASA